MVLIRKIEPLLRNREGGAQQWSDYLAELRGKYKAKRNFMKLLSALR